MPTRRTRRDRGRRRADAPAPFSDPAPRADREIAGRRPSVAAVAIGAGIVLCAAAVYTATAARDIVFGDSPELTGVALTWGVAHPPGYPVFAILGWIFGQLPVGPEPFRVALLSVACHAATVGVIYVTTARFTRRVAAAAVAASVLAFDPLFWSWSLVAEVFPLNDLLAATMLLLVALWHEHPERGRWLVGAALIGGIGMAGQQTIALLSPAIAFVMWRRRQALIREPRILLRAAAAFAAGLLPYLTLLVAAARRSAWVWADLATPTDLVAHVLRRDYGTASLTPNPAFTGGSVTDLLLAFVTSFDPVRLMLLVVGAVYVWRVMRWYAAFLLMAAAVPGPLFAVYTNAFVSDDVVRAVVERFFLLPHTVLAPLAGFAVLAVAEVAALAGRRRVAELAGGVLAVAAALASIPLRFGEIDRSTDRVARAYAADMLSGVPDRAIVLAGNDEVFALEYVQRVDGVRPDVAIVSYSRMNERYAAQVRREHPDVAIPHDANTREVTPILNANYGKRPMVVFGFLPENAAYDAYRFYPRGLVYDVRRKDELVQPSDVAATNEAVLTRYHPPRPDEVGGPHRSWDRLALAEYATPYYRVGVEFENAAVGLQRTDATRAPAMYEEARKWYRRALAVAPEFNAARIGLDRLPPPVP